MRVPMVILLMSAFLLQAQVNTWHRRSLAPAESLFRSAGSLVYLPDSDRFLISMGFLSKTFRGSPSPYSEQVLSLRDTIWKNFLPAGKLGVWGDTVGLCDSVAYSPYFRIELHNGIVRPSLASSNAGKAYYQYAYDSHEKKVYYYIENNTVRFDPATRTWAVLNPSVDPAGGPNLPGGGAWSLNRLRWASMAYDPVNRELLLVGGGCAIVPRGSVGSWIYKPSTNTWTKLAAAVEPEPRALSQMVYDAKNRVIVLFSGDHLDYMHGDTWIYACSTRTWVRKHPAVSPEPRSGHAMVYLPRSRKVVMFGGYDYDYDWSDRYGDQGENDPLDSLEMWTYDVADGPEGSWKLIKKFTNCEPAGMGWAGRAAPLQAAADSADRIVCIGEPVAGNRYYHYGLTWVMDCDPSQVDAAGTLAHGWPADSAKKRIRRWDPAWFKQDPTPVDTGAQEAFLRNLTPNTWTYFAQPRYPIGGRSYGKAAIASDRGVIFHWGGGHAEVCQNDMPLYDIHSNRWSIPYAGESALEYDRSDLGGAPGNLTFNNRPTMVSHAYDGYDYCPILKKLLLFHYQATYLFDPDKGDWDSAAIPHAANMVNLSTLSRVLNATPHGMVAWADVSNYSRLWILDTTTLRWRDLPVKNGWSQLPAPWCETHMLVYDSRRDRLLFARNSQNKAGTFNGQIWEYRFADSTLAALNPANAGRVNAMYYLRDAVYIDATDQVLMQDTISADGRSGLGVYDCATNQWKLAPVTSAAGRSWSTSSNCSPMLYDKRRNLVFSTNIRNEIAVMNYRDSAHTLSVEESAAASDLPGLTVTPNPFHPAATITGFGSIRGRGRVTVHDLSGRLVAEFPCNGAVRWNARDGRDRPLPAGLYFISLKVDRHVVRARAVLAR